MKVSYVNYIGWFASVMAIIMYVSYLDQIKLNLAGDKGSVIQPLSAVFNCTLWLLYGYLKPKKDWPMVVCNIPGIVLGAIAFYTAL
jgi:uncharacterized protein with PQ loop repeat